jgi:secondary thiamine-phosphate synthase enzyme
LIKEIRVSTQKRSQMLDITGLVNQRIKESGVNNGICCVFVPHTTAGITINENADPDVVSDILRETDKMVPWDDGYRHIEGNSAAHIKASMMGFSQVIFIESGRLVLGTWQGIYFCEFDGPRNRKVLIKTMEG